MPSLTSAIKFKYTLRSSSSYHPKKAVPKRGSFSKHILRYKTFHRFHSIVHNSDNPFYLRYTNIERDASGIEQNISLCNLIIKYVYMPAFLNSFDYPLVAFYCECLRYFVSLQ